MSGSHMYAISTVPDSMHIKCFRRRRKVCWTALI